MTLHRVELREDHMLVHLDGRAAALAPRRDVVIPYSDIVDARAAPPEWPTMAGQWQIAAYLPRVVAVGDFHEWNGRRRLLAFDRRTKEALRLQLKGHPAYDEVCVDAEDAAMVAAAVQRHLPADAKAWSGPAPRE